MQTSARHPARYGSTKVPDYSYAYLWDTREWLPYAEYDRRWPQHPPLKAYTDRRMVNLLDADWGDAPPPRSSADM